MEDTALRRARDGVLHCVQCAALRSARRPSGGVIDKLLTGAAANTDTVARPDNSQRCLAPRR